MASPIGYQLSIKDSDFVDTWLQCFAVSAITKKLKDNKEKRAENEITDFFSATAGCKAIILSMAYPTNLKDLTFEKISQIIRRNMRPKKRLVMEERRKFMSMKQKIDEPIIIYKISIPSTKCE